MPEAAARSTAVNDGGGGLENTVDNSSICDEEEGVLSLLPVKEVLEMELGESELEGATEKKSNT